jgi:hypothetical protein
VTGGGPEQQLDLYIPTDHKGEPLVVYVHGGGWEHGDKAGDSINPNNLQWLWQGYAMASINYRLIQHAVWPAQIEDCKAAIRWLKAHARDYGYDPDRLGVVGESAGGHLVALLGTTSGLQIFIICVICGCSECVKSACIAVICGSRLRVLSLGAVRHPTSKPRKPVRDLLVRNQFWRTVIIARKLRDVSAVRLLSAFCAATNGKISDVFRS